MDFKDNIEAVGEAIDWAGVGVIALGLVAATLFFGYRLLHRAAPLEAFRQYRQNVGRAILLGLEFLVAADIIRTVAIEPSFRGVGVLAVIVAIRTFLSFTLELELEGRWPWQAAKQR